MAIHDFMDRDITPLPNNHITLIDRCISTKAKIEYSYKNIYVDLDDTLIIDGYAVPKVISFIYQALTQDKEVFLITRHEYDIFQTLSQARISPSIFKKIIHVKNNESKAEYIMPNSIFIDNYFYERKEVFDKKKCLVLDVDAVELFLL